MKKYQYRFESILRIRELQREEAERAFREAMLELENALQALETLVKEKAGILGDLLELRKNGSAVNYQLLWLDYLRALETRIADQQQEVQKCNERVEQRRQELLEAMTEHKALDKLKDKDHDSWLLELKRWEQALMDELSLLRYGQEGAAAGYNI